ncbi:MAG: hypothetical protein IJY17_01360 [Alphaproteobacteria bacterium]|nr:hypothetical protein [Alphaproteobacteria bacterium]
MTDNANQPLQTNIEKENKKTGTTFNIMYDLLDKAHRLVRVSINAKDVNETIKEYDREKAIQLIVKNINKHENLLHLLASITGRYIVYQSHFYDDKPDEIILCDLKYIRNVIYFNEIKNAGLEAFLKKKLKKLNLIP